MSKKDFNDLKEICETGVNGRSQHFSRTKFGYCKNKGCYNRRRNMSAYCQECSDKFNMVNYSVEKCVVCGRVLETENEKADGECKECYDRLEY